MKIHSTQIGFGFIQASSRIDDLTRIDLARLSGPIVFRQNGHIIDIFMVLFFRMSGSGMTSKEPRMKRWRIQAALHKFDYSNEDLLFVRLAI